MEKPTVVDISLRNAARAWIMQRCNCKTASETLQFLRSAIIVMDDQPKYFTKQQFLDKLVSAVNEDDLDVLINAVKYNQVLWFE